MILSRPAVRPRIVPANSSESVLLEDWVAEFLETHRRGTLEILGDPQSGKTTALSYLTTFPFADRLTLIDNGTPSTVLFPLADEIVVYTCERTLGEYTQSCRLAPWNDDDLIEYLLAVHPEQCRSVMERFTADPDKVLLDGVPVLYKTIADKLASSDEIPDIQTAMRQTIAELVGDEETLAVVRQFTLLAFISEFGGLLKLWDDFDNLCVGSDLKGLISHRYVALLLSADQIINLLKNAPNLSELESYLHIDLVIRVAELASSDREIKARLAKLANSTKENCAPVAASIIHLADPGWRPGHNRNIHYKQAYLFDARWNEINLSDMDLSGADLRSSELRSANLCSSKLHRTNLRSCHLQGALMAFVRAIEADLAGANLTDANLTGGKFAGADLSDAVLKGISGEDASFKNAKLHRASFQDAILKCCDLRGALLRETDFRNADLTAANLSGHDLRSQLLSGANLTRCDLYDCNLENCQLLDVCLEEADLRHALLTASMLRGANMRNVDLTCAGLADIDWEGVDLRGAYLTGASFHMGSTRDGLVGSPYPCHGSRTGFYTDDFDDQNYKPIEEIRKANLSGADLRGANITDVDFYLVDLRGAKYDQHQEVHFRNCNAILDDFQG